MKRLILAALCCPLLSGCIFDPVFDTSSWDAYQRSSAAVKAKLSNDELRRLEIAMKYLVTESTPKLEIDGQLVSNVVAGGSLENPYIILSQIGARINGRSAAAVIQNLSIKLGAEISETEARLQIVESVSGPVEISSANFNWRRDGYLEQPVIEFAVFNGGKLPISRIYFRTILTTPNRSIPWVNQEFVQFFRGGLEPREKQQLTLQPRYGDWNDPRLKDLPNAKLKVVVTNFEDANGEKVVAVDSHSLDLKRKVRAELQ